MTALGQLIEDQRALVGRPGPPRSYQQIADRAGRRGATISKSTVFNLATKPLDNVPPTDTLRALAVGLDLPLSVVVDAALESVGLRRTSSPDTRWTLIQARASELPERRRRALEAQVEALLAMHDEDGDP